MKARTALLVLAVAAAPAVAAGGRDDIPPRTIQVNGSGVGSGIPDQAEIEIGVVTQAKDAESAASENAKRLAAVLAAVRKALPQDAELETSRYTLSPNFRGDGSSAPRIDGYSVTNVISIKTTDLERVSRIVDTAMAAGANTIHALRFTLRDDRSVRAQALRQAVEDARGQADVIAATLGVKVGRVRSVEAERFVVPVGRIEGFAAMSALAAPQRPPTPVELGTVDVRASARVTFDVGE